MILGGVAFVVLFFGMVGLFGNSGSPQHQSPPATFAEETPKSPKECLKLANDHWEYEPVAIGGTITNGCGRKFSTVMVSFKLFDKPGNVIGTASSFQGNLAPGETWKFSALALESGIRGYMLDEITAF